MKKAYGGGEGGGGRRLSTPLAQRPLRVEQLSQVELEKSKRDDYNTKKSVSCTFRETCSSSS